MVYCRRARRGRPSGVRLYSLVGDVDSPVARVGAVADRQEVDLVSAAAAPEPRYLKNEKKNIRFNILFVFCRYSNFSRPGAAQYNQTTLYGVENPGDGTVLKLFFAIQWCLVFNDCLRLVMKFL